MMDKNELKELIQYMQDFDNQRELLIKKSRDVLKLSKQIIYCVHREDIDGAEKHAEGIKLRFKELVAIGKQNAELTNVGAFKVAGQEYTEALCYLAYVKGEELPTYKTLGVNIPNYLSGLCDLTGEIVRKAINDVINGDKESAIRAKKFTDELYGDLLMFDFKNVMRKSFDRIKYDLRRLEDVVLSIKLKEE